MAANYVLLEKITVGAAGASSVTFSGIPQTGYTDLVVKASARITGSGFSTPGALYVNTNLTTYSQRYILGDGGSASSGNNAFIGMFGTVPNTGYTASTFGSADIYIPNYTSSNFKSTSAESVSETNGTTAYAMLNAGLISSTGAITSITLSSDGPFNQYSTFYLYGVAKLGTTPAIVPYATGGDTIMTDGTYWYHTFLSSGTFTPQKAITCDYLVVAGGGSGGTRGGIPLVGGGGGGAGGLRSTVTATGGGGSLESALALASGTAYTVTIGAGGAMPGSGPLIGTNGSNSVFSTITSTGGGGGGVYGPGSAPAIGGSGGGAGRDVTVTTAGAAGTANQGYAGGGTNTSSGRGGGGGGAGAVGVAGASTTGGEGGNGVTTSISGSSVTYAGGGGGGAAGGTACAGGTGGGGTGAVESPFTAAVAGTANRGGGGGGGGISTGNGGSGIVIVRYAV